MSNSRNSRIPAERPFMKVFVGAALDRTRPMGRPRKMVNPATAPRRMVWPLLTRFGSPVLAGAAQSYPMSRPDRPGRACHRPNVESEAVSDSPPKRLFLLDGHSLSFRAFFALPTDLATSTGQITNAVYGFTSMLIKLLGEERPDLIAVAFDVGKPTVRLEKYAEYKAGRAETPDEFRQQLGLIVEVLETLRVPIVGIEGHEADDAIGTLGVRAC